MPSKSLVERQGCHRTELGADPEMPSVDPRWPRTRLATPRSTARVATPATLGTRWGLRPQDTLVWLQLGRSSDGAELVWGRVRASVTTILYRSALFRH